ncbi:hypothetical protein O3P69_008597 [Scylla paramamosain]|uniref:Uncharacterized protein n=1 Tax=Scylla paramamosain TaxID=85552 RepID=A0AAW0SLB7_SCYPA
MSSTVPRERSVSTDPASILRRDLGVRLIARLGAPGGPERYVSSQTCAWAGQPADTERPDSRSPALGRWGGTQPTHEDIAGEESGDSTLKHCARLVS